MSTRFWLVCSVCVLLSSQLQAATSLADHPLSQKLVYDVYRPLHAQFADLSARQRSNYTKLCQRRPASSAYRLQSDFTDLIEAFSAIELFRLGPLLEENRKNRLFYWPDKRRVGERQLRNLLNSEEVATLSVDQLAAKSVALQGFAALERLLFTPGLHPLEQAPQCHLISIVIRNIENMATQLNEEWQSDSDYVKALLRPTASSKHFRTSDEVLRTVFTQVKVGLDVVLNSKLAPLLSKDPKQMAQSPLWLSQRSIAMLTGNLRGLQSLLLNSGLLANTRFQEELRFEFEYVEHVLGKLKSTVYLIEPNGELKRETRLLLNQIAAVVSGIRHVVSTEVAKTLDISAGFNSEEGD